MAVPYQVNIPGRGSAPWEWWMERDPITGVPFASIAPTPPKLIFGKPHWQPQFPTWQEATTGAGRHNVMFHFLAFNNRDQLKRWGVPDNYAKDYITLQDATIWNYWPYFERQLIYPNSRWFTSINYTAWSAGNPPIPQMQTRYIRARDIYSNVPAYTGGDLEPPTTEKLYWIWKDATNKLHAYVDPQKQTIQNRIKEESQKTNNVIKAVVQIIITTVVSVVTIGLLTNLVTQVFGGTEPEKPVGAKEPLPDTVTKSVEDDTITEQGSVDPNVIKALNEAKDLAEDTGKGGHDRMDWFEKLGESLRTGLKTSLQDASKKAGEFLGNQLSTIDLGFNDSSGVDVTAPVTGQPNSQAGGSEGVATTEQTWIQRLKTGLLQGFLKTDTGQQIQSDAKEAAINQQIASLVKSPLPWVAGIAAVFLVLAFVRR